MRWLGPDDAGLGARQFRDPGVRQRADRARPRKQPHLIFPVLDIDLGPRWEFNVGVGAGRTPATDRLIVKMILGYRLGALPAPEPGR
jgi:hypothetical protein